MGYARGSGPYLDGKPLGGANDWQKILNESWPEKDEQGNGCARNVYYAPIDKIIPCIVRLDFAQDGEMVLDGTAERWTRSHVYVTLDDARVSHHAVWVRARDVRRR